MTAAIIFSVVPALCLTAYIFRVPLMWFAAGVAALIAAILPGCSVLKVVEDAPITVQIITTQATGRFIRAKGLEGIPERRERIKAFVSRAETAIDTASDTSVSNLIDKVKEQINYEGLFPEDQALIDSVLPLIKANLEKKIELGELPKDVTIPIHTLLNYMKATAMGYDKYK